MTTLLAFVEQLGRRSVNAVREIGYHPALFIEAVYWLTFGRWRRQPVRLRAIFKEALGVGVHFMRDLLDSMAYVQAPQGFTNCLQLKKRIF